MSRCAPRPVRRRWAVWLKRSGAGALVLILTFGGYGLYVRFVRLNFHTVVEGQVYRSSQPTGRALRRWARQYGLRTVINLRGGNGSDLHSDAEDLLQEGELSTVSVSFSAGRAPTRGSLLRFIDALETAQRPLLLHCRAGVDRTGVAAAIAKMAVGGASFEQARSQLSLGYLYVERGGRHIADLLDAYEHYCARTNQPTGNWEHFRTWVLEEYRPYHYYVDIEAPKVIEAEAGSAVRTTVRITNRSSHSIPAGEPGVRYRLGCFLGRRETEWPDYRRRRGQHVDLPRKDLEPGESVEVAHSFHAPSEPGRYVLHWDVTEIADRPTWFGREGSPVAEFALVTTPGRSD